MSEMGSQLNASSGRCMGHTYDPLVSISESREKEERGEECVSQPGDGEEHEGRLQAMETRLGRSQYLWALERDGRV